jgi:acyl-coenzyme A synthetase/AMP-(fatty) acid ligase
MWVTKPRQAFFRNGCFYPGDLGIMLPDGRIALQGRVTDVINVNGRGAPTSIEVPRLPRRAPTDRASRADSP